MFNDVYLNIGASTHEIQYFGNLLKIHVNFGDACHIKGKVAVKQVGVVFL